MNISKSGIYLPLQTVIYFCIRTRPAAIYRFNALKRFFQPFRCGISALQTKIDLAFSSLSFFQNHIKYSFYQVLKPLCCALFSMFKNQKMTLKILLSKVIFFDLSGYLSLPLNRGTIPTPRRDLNIIFPFLKYQKGFSGC